MSYSMKNDKDPICDVSIVPQNITAVETINIKLVFAVLKHRDPRRLPPTSQYLMAVDQSCDGIPRGAQYRDPLTGDDVSHVSHSVPPYTHLQL